MTAVSQDQQTRSDESFRAELRAWLEANLTDAFREKRIMTFREKVAVRRAWQKTLFEAGWIGIGWPKEYGGRGASLMQEAIYNEEMARARAPAAANVIGLNMAGPTLLAVGTAEQKARYLPRILSAEEIWCQGFSEPNAGSDVASLQTKAVRESDHFVVNGQKVWTSYGYVADYCILLVRTDFEVPKHKGLSYLIVDMHSPGVSTKPLVQMTGEAEFAELFFDNVKVPAENLVGELNKGWIVALTTLMHERGTLSLSVIVAFEQRLQALFELSRNSTLHGKPALQDQQVRQRLARLYTDVKTFKLNTMAQMSAIGQGHLPGPEGSLLKLHWSELNQRLVELAFELEGPFSALAPDSVDAPSEGRWQYEYLRARGNTIEAGTSEVQRNIIADRVLGLPRG
ncbi:MAG TPA: acyl-CoA dehydrogenase [Ktedonobacterales bacterium]|jgi:alkylation response protein AidB-like acyl-CoA dehydrogenase